MRDFVIALIVLSWLLAACGGGGAVATPADDGASSPAVECGATVSADLVLTADLTCPEGIALTIDAPGVTLNLNGHTLTGPGPGRRRWPLPDFDLAGVSVRANDVTVTNGTLRGFGIGIVVEDASGVTISDVTTVGGYYGVYLYGGAGHTVERSQIVENVYGLHLEQTSGVTVVDNELSRQTHHSPGGYGIYLHAANDNLIEGNWIRDNLNWGIWLSDSTANTLIRNNVSNNNLTEVSDDTGGNQWYDPELREGNFWGDYAGADGNGDGIGDVPYSIGGPGRSQDLYPFIAASGWENRDGPTVAQATPVPSSPSPPRAYVTLDDGQVIVIDPVKGIVLNQWQFAPGSGAQALGLDGATLYVASGAGTDAEVVAIETATGTVSGRYSVPGVYVIAAMYNGRALIAAGSDGLVEIEMKTGVVNALPSDGEIVAVTPSWKHSLAFVTAGAEVSVTYLPDKHAPYSVELPGIAYHAVDNRSGTRLFVTVDGEPDILVLDTEIFETTARVPLGAVTPEDARFVPSPDGALLYLLDTATSQLKTIDLATLRVISNVNVGGEARQIGVSGDGEHVIVSAATEDGGRVIIFNPELQPLGSIDIDAAPLGLAVPR